MFRLSFIPEKKSPRYALLTNLYVDVYIIVDPVCHRAVDCVCFYLYSVFLSMYFVHKPDHMNYVDVKQVSNSDAERHYVNTNVNDWNSYSC